MPAILTRQPEGRSPAKRGQIPERRLCDHHAMWSAPAAATARKALASRRPGHDVRRDDRDDGAQVRPAGNIPLNLLGYEVAAGDGPDLLDRGGVIRGRDGRVPPHHDGRVGLLEGLDRESNPRVAQQVAHPGACFGGPDRHDACVPPKPYRDDVWRSVTSARWR